MPNLMVTLPKTATQDVIHNTAHNSYDNFPIILQTKPTHYSQSKSCSRVNF